MKTFMAKRESVQKKWYVVDASTKPLGRLATRIATILMGKHKPTYTPNTDTGDFVVVINAANLKLTGNKPDVKVYQRYSGHPHGRKETKFSTYVKTQPETIVYEAVRRMLPKNTIGRYMFRKLKVYPGMEHPHQAQQLESIKL